MVIQSNNINAHANTAGKTKHPTTSATDKNVDAQSKINPASTKDSVSLSPEAKSIAKIEANIHHTSDVNTQKVADIKAAITSGNYKIDNDAIAKAILDDETYL